MTCERSTVCLPKNHSDLVCIGERAYLPAPAIRPGYK